jgi:hypothetical protein
MISLPLLYRAGHLFLEIDDQLWLMDTGSPLTFGDVSHLSVGDQRFAVQPSLLGVSATAISQATGVACHGLMGCDILNQFDHLWSIPHGSAVLGRDLAHPSDTTLPVVLKSGVPTITVQIGDVMCPAAFDTGAQLSYVTHPPITTYPTAGSFTDFHPKFGSFVVDTHYVPIQIAGTTHTLRCGILPPLIALLTAASGIAAVIGNEIMQQRIVGYFPQRRIVYF